MFGAAQRISHDRERLPLALRGWRISLFSNPAREKTDSMIAEVRLQHRISDGPQESVRNGPEMQFSRFSARE
jgi:hypothetical protein